MTDKTAMTFYKIHKVGQWLLRQKSMLLQSLGGLVIQFNMGACYASVINQGMIAERRMKKNAGRNKKVS